MRLFTHVIQVQRTKKRKKKALLSVERTTKLSSGIDW